jgi:hypothetical protein
VVPDSAGPLSLPAVSYGYYDSGGARISLSRAAGSIAAGVLTDAPASTALAAGLAARRLPRIGLADGARHSDWGWIVIFLLPPILISLRGRPLPRRAAARPVVETGLRAAEERLDQVVRGLVPDPDQRSRVGLAAAVRAAGADGETASRVAAVPRTACWRGAMVPPGQTAEDQALVQEVEELVRRLGDSLRGWGGRVAPIVLLLGLVSAGMYAQAPPPPEGLYEAGALQAAADGFSRRAALEPTVAANWYDLGATYYRLGAKGRATAAWVQARRLAPREPNVLRALRLTPAPDVNSARMLWSPPLPRRAAAGGRLGVVRRLDWLGAAPPTSRPLVGAPDLRSDCSAGRARTRAWYHRPVAVVLDQTTMRLSPHGRAPAVGPTRVRRRGADGESRSRLVLVRSGRPRVG